VDWSAAGAQGRGSDWGLLVFDWRFVGDCWFL